MGEKMTLDEVSAALRNNADGLLRMDEHPILANRLRKLADAIDAHPTQPAQAVDVPKGWSAENLKRCCRELNKLIELAGDYLFDEMTVATFETSIACILVCLAALPNANGKEGS